ncbi:MAG: hypothetical protein ACYC0T_14575 [Ramlibacter sp.]
MRFSAAIQPTAPRGPAPVARPVPPPDDAYTLPAPQPPLPACEVPPDLDQRVRLTGEW